MKTVLYSLATLLSVCLFFSCQKDISRQGERQTDSQSASTAVNSTGSSSLQSVCGEPQTRDLGNPLANFATLAVSNDNDNVYITFSAVSGYLLKQASGVIGDLAHLQSVLLNDADPAVGPNPPDFIQNFSPEASSYQFTIPRSGLNDCFLINVHAVLVKKDGLGTVTDIQYVWALTENNITSYPFSTYFEYCVQDCPPPPPPPGDCGQLRTETPGGWGAVPAGQNSGTYLHANFATAFPNGLTVGCYPSNYYIKLTSAQAITNLLPTGGTPAALKSNYTDPASLKNELVGQLVALTLSVGFDDYYPDFGQAGMGLGDMKIGGSGVFAGWTVRDFLAEANKVLGGCSTNYTASQVEETVDKINKNYDDGIVDLGFLVCPQ